MDWDKLRVFHAVADAGSLTHAGEQLDLSQSAISRQIRGLEEQLQATLFHRHARGLLLTEQGELLYEATLSMTKRLNMAAARIRDSKDEVHGDLRVTATDTGDSSISDAFTLTVQNVNEAPTVTAPLADQTVQEDAAFSFTVPAATFADVDAVHGDTLTYGATLANGSALPSWLSFEPATRTFSGIPLKAPKPITHQPEHQKQRCRNRVHDGAVPAVEHLHTV